MGQFTAILAGTNEGKSLFAIRKMAEHTVRGDCSIIYFSDTNNVMQKCRSYEGVTQNHHVTVVYLQSSDCITTMNDALVGRDYDCIFVDYHRQDDEFISYLHGLSRNYNVFFTYQLPRASIESESLTDCVPPPFIVPLVTRAIFLLRDDVGIVGEYHFDKDSRSFAFCRYYFIEDGANGYPRLDIFGDEYDPTEQPWQIEDRLYSHVLNCSPLR